MKISNEMIMVCRGQAGLCAALFRFRGTRKFVAFVLSLFLVSSSLLNRVHAAAGDLDPSFGSGGKVTTDFFGVFDGVAALAIQPDGKIVAVGSTDTDPSSAVQVDFALARYNSDGSLDSTFGTGGKVNTDLFGLNEDARAVVIQRAALAATAC